MRAACACAVLFAGLAAAAPVPKEPLVPPVPPVTEEHLKASRQNLKHIALAFHNYHDFNNGLCLPANICDKNGKPLLSWRVAILPFLDEEDKLYQEFKLDEA